MMVRKSLIILALMFCYFIGAAQQKTFVMQRDVKYVKGMVQVKVKSEFKDEFVTNSSARVKSLPMKSIKPLAHPLEVQKGASWRGPLAAKPTVDIARYFKVSFDPSQDVEKYINQLYSTGYFEIVEPLYARYTSLTPNDPAVATQYYLERIKAIEAWDINVGSADLTIAIVDTGGNLTHPDLVGNLYRNAKEYPPNGKDDDNDGYIDNFQGWDFIGADTAKIGSLDSIDDNDPTIHKGGELSHGTWVAGCASASANNGIGIAGVGYNTKLMFTKHTADNQLTTDGGIYFGFDGIIYAAHQGIKIINCSWGGSGSSQIEQDIINYVTVDLGSLVVAAAGNGGNGTASYPGAYTNVLEVAATDKNDVAAVFTTFGSTVSLSAPGVGIYTTGFDGVYNTVDGTSFSSPITAGAAALVWTKYPNWTPQQVAQQLRVSSDATALYTANPTFVGKLGHGRLDIHNALSTSLPAIRASNPQVLDASGVPIQPGESGFVTFDFTNFLQPTSSNIKVTLSSTSVVVKIKKSTITPGIIGTNQTVNNSLIPFQMSLNNLVLENTIVDLTLTFSDGSYQDSQTLSLIVNPSFLNINSNQITTSISENGHIGYQNPGVPSLGSGFIFNQNQIMSEIGLIMGTDSAHIYNNVRGQVSKATGVVVNDDDFGSTMKLKQILPGLRSYSEDYGEFSDSLTTTARKHVLIDYRSLVWKDVPYDKFVIFEYKIKNPTNASLNNFYFGIFADWDITNEGQFDAADWYPKEKMGYIYPAQASTKPYAGTQLLTGSANYYAIDNNPGVATAPSFAVNDGYSDGKKFLTLSTPRLQAGMSTPTGNDVSHVVSSGPWNIAPGQTITVAFALHAANNLADLKISSAYADTLYNMTLTAPKPIVDTTTACYNSSVAITATGAGKFNWYKNFTGGKSFFTGNQFMTTNLTSDTTFYVSNADNSYESVRTPAVVLLKANPKISTSGATTFCSGQSITLSVGSADSYLWSTGETTQSIQVNKADVYSVTVKDNGLACTSNSDPITTVVNTPPTANFTETGVLKEGQAITFKDGSTNAASYFWQFGDGNTSTDQNPVHTYSTGLKDTVTLTVTDINGCQNSIKVPYNIVTGLEAPQGILAVYPNPVHQQSFMVELNENEGTIVNLNMVNLLGVSIYQEEFQTTGLKTTHEVSVKALPDGIYILRVKSGDQMLTKKVVKREN